MLKPLEDFADIISVRNASIRTKVTLALMGVVVLILPQIVLTVAYMVRFFEGGSRIERLARVANSLHDGGERLIDFVQSEIPHHESQLTARKHALEDLLRRLKEKEEALSDVVQNEQIAPFIKRYRALVPMLKEHETFIATYLASIEGQPQPIQALTTPGLLLLLVEDGVAHLEPQPNARSRAELEARVGRLEALLESVSSRFLEAVSADDDVRLKRAMRQSEMTVKVGRKARQIVRAYLSLEGDLWEAVRGDAKTIQSNVDEANRYLITLVLITLVYIAVMCLVLPTRLVRPLGHFSSVMKRAASGQLEVRARVVGDDEMAQLGANLNQMIEQIRIFDDLKRNRIHEDQGRIHFLANLLPYPVACVDTHMRLEFANRVFCRVFGLKPGFEDKLLPHLLAGPDADRLIEHFDAVILRRRPVSEVPLSLTHATGTTDYLLTIDIGRNRAGAISHLMVQLRPSDEPNPS